MTSAAETLALQGISKRFASVQALKDVSLSVRRGTVHAVLGENGAGKSTLMRIALGVLRPDAGVVAVGGRATPYDGRPHRTLGMVHQHLSLVPTMTAVENFELGGSGRLNLGAAARRMEEVGRASGLRVAPSNRVSEMSVVQQQRLEILKALGRDASVIIMDEPTAVLAPSEARDVIAWIRGFAAQGGSVVLVTHKLREALSVANHVTVLRRGTVVWQGDAGTTSESQLAAAMFPAAPPGSLAAPEPSSGATCVRARALQITEADGRPAIRGAEFEIARGDIVGIAAVEGSGQRALLAALARRRAAASGALELPPRIAFIPADRRRDGVVEEMTLTENVALRGLGERRGRMPWAALREQAADLIRRYDISAPSPEIAAGALSGGNQQRLVVGRELSGAVDLVVADNASRGLDLKATAFVHDRLRQAATDGAAVVVHSSDVDEVLSLATRIFVVHHGIVSEAPLDRDLVGRAMLGAAAEHVE